MAESTQDPREREPRPPFPEQQQPHPGFESDMEPRPDWGLESYRGHEKLLDRVALVTGGDSGIGRAVALAFAREGADVAISYLEEHEDAATIEDAIREAGRTSVLLAGDLETEARCREVVERTIERFGRIDILVNNAAFQGRDVDDIEELDVERIEYTFRVNIISMFHLVRAALPHMEAGSTIINVSSIQAYDPNPGILDYATTKGAIVTYTKGLSRALAGRGIRVNAVAPGAVWTPLIPQSFEADHVREHGKKSLLGRPAQPVELAPAFVFLASNDSSYVTGEILGVTGGVLLP